MTIDEIKLLRNQKKRYWGKFLIDYIKPWLDNGDPLFIILHRLNTEYDFEISHNALYKLIVFHRKNYSTPATSPLVQVAATPVVQPTVEKPPLTFMEKFVQKKEEELKKSSDISSDFGSDANEMLRATAEYERKKREEEQFGDFRAKAARRRAEREAEEAAETAQKSGKGM